MAMATVSMDAVELQQGIQTKLDIEQLIKEPTWREVLLDLVGREKLDPWNIDLIEIVDKYIGIVKNMKMLDLRVPANLILAASILLRFKSDMLKMEEEIEQDDNQQVLEERQHVEVEELGFRARLPPRRRVTLNELMSALEEVMEIKEVRQSALVEEPINIPININPVDIEEEIENVYETIKGSLDSSNMTTFSNLCNKAPDNVLLGIFVPLLLLAHQERIFLMQEKFFDEILIGIKNT